MVGGSITTVNEGVKKRGMGQESGGRQEEVDPSSRPAVGSLVPSEGQCFWVHSTESVHQARWGGCSSLA